MGIRFRCPNGHKLNVKSFLAGKRGVCPDCGQTFRIPPEGTDDSAVVAMPLASRRNGSAREEEDNLAESDFETAVAVAAAAISEPTRSTAAAQGVVFLPPMPGREALSQPVALQSPAPQTPAPQLPSPQAPATSAPDVAANKAAAPGIFFGPVTTPTPPQPAGHGQAPSQPAPAPLPAPPPPPKPGDPIAEAPQAVWYVRPPSGGQYGPARGDVMRKWIAEGRVSGDSLVWREGWSDWREAGQLFGALATPSAGPVSPSPQSALPGPAASGLLPTVAATSAPRTIAERKPAGRKRGNEMAVAALVCLVLVCVILVTVLVIVLSRGSA